MQGTGEPDGGAQSSNGTSEAQTNLDITLKVQKLLEQSGATVILTRIMLRQISLFLFI